MFFIFLHILPFFANNSDREEAMKELMTLLGFGAGMITGALLYKHSLDAKSRVNKGEKAVKKEINEMKEKVEPKLEKIKKEMKKM